VSAPWGHLEANPLRDIQEFMTWAEQLYRANVTVPFAVLAPPPLGCPDCGMALPDCHMRHGEGHCGQHDLQVCLWARA
jgi:hypothetical protein